MALSLQTIATKTNTENAWLAWIPVVNLILMLNIAKKPIWWFILNADSARKYRSDQHRLDGDCRSQKQAELVGNFDDCADCRDYCAGVFGLV